MSEAARRSLEELQASILLASDFPKRITYTHPQYLELLKARSANPHTPGLEAIERVRNQVRHLRNLIDLLGRERYEPSVPILARLWKDCALQPVWVAVGHALFEIATPEATAAFLSSIEDQDSFARHMAIKRPLPVDLARRSTISTNASGSWTTSTGYWRTFSIFCVAGASGPIPRTA